MIYRVKDRDMKWYFGPSLTLAKSSPSDFKWVRFKPRKVHFKHVNPITLL